MLRDDYNRIIPRTWDRATQPLVPDARRMAVALRANFKRHVGRRMPYRVEITRRVKHTWVRDGVLQINPDAGWVAVNHLFSHWIADRLGLKPHCDRHLEIERECAAYIVRRYFS